MSSEELLEAFRYPGDKKKALALLPVVPHPEKIIDSSWSNSTLLHWAASNGWTELCQLLIDQYQADPHCRTSSGYSALHYAAINGSTELCQLLIDQYQADPHCRDNSGGTALHYACDDNNTALVQYLVTAINCDPMVASNSGRTPLGLSYGETRDFLQEIIAKSRLAGFSNVVEYLKHTKAVVDEAMAKGSGELSQDNILFHGPPGAGKSSVKCLILGQPPRPKHKQNATDILENAVRTVCVDRVVTMGKHFMEVENDDIISMIAEEVEKYRKRNKSTVTSTPSESSRSQDTTTDQQTTSTQTKASSATATDNDVEAPPKDIVIVTTKAIKQKLVNSNFDSKYSCKIFDARWLHHIDSGGQPQFLDVFPLLYRSPCHFIVVMRLTEGLDDRPKVRFYNKGNDEYCLPDHLVLTNREMIIRVCQIAQSTAQATGGKSVPRVMVVGTHLDQIEPLNRSKCLKELNEQLAPVHKTYNEVMVCKSFDEYVFPVNAMAEGKERQQYTEELQERVLSATKHVGDPVKVPLKWLTFHLELDKGEGVVKMPECYELGEKLGMTEETVRVALQFLNEAALVLYYPNEVPDLVLTKMNPFTNRLSRLVKGSFIPPDDGPTKESDDLRKKGVFKKEFLRRVFDGLEESLLSDDEFLMILECLKIAVNIGGDEYFLPSALSLEPPTKGSSFNCQSNPLALMWDGLILPHGFFLTVSVEMQEKSEREGGYVFELRPDLPQWRGEIQLSERTGKIPGVVKLTDRQRWIQVSYSGGMSYCPTVYRVVNSATQRAIKRLQHTGIKSPTIEFLCPCGEEKEHYCYLSEDRRSLTCSINRSRTDLVTEKLSCWLYDNSFLKEDDLGQSAEQSIDQLILSKRPDLKDVCDLLLGRSSKWEDIAIVLAVDGDYRDQLRSEGVQSSSLSKLERVLRKWAESECSDVTWGTVFTVSKRLQFNDVMKSIEQFLTKQN